MMKKFLDFIFSMQFAGALLLVFAAAIGTATFIENDFGTLAAQVLVYKAVWFEILLAVGAISLIGSVFKYRLYQRKKISVLVFHLSFVVILIGAAVTRYAGYEGILHIREGESSNELVSDQPYVQVWVDDGEEVIYDARAQLFSPYKNNRYHETIEASDGKQVDIKLKEYVANAAEIVEETPDGVPILSFVTVDDQGRRSAYLKHGEVFESDSLLLSFEAGTTGPEAVAFYYKAGSFTFMAPYDVILTDMMQSSTDTLPAGDVHEVQVMKLYNMKGKSVVFRNLFPAATTRLVSAQGGRQGSGANAAVFSVNYGGMTEDIAVLGGKGILGEPVSVTMDGLEVAVSYGSKIIELPFALHLRDFELERYPGSNSPASFASEVTVIDKNKGVELPYRIYMNNILNYGGYRFFQSSYDPDEQGTILSVNHDSWGTAITYIGYALLTAGLLFNFFTRNSRFRMLARGTANRKTTIKTATLASVLGFMILGSSPVMAQHQGVQDVTEFKIDKKHADRFGELVVQDKDGRMKPANTLASEIMRKVYRKDSYRDLNSNQVLLGMMVNPGLWQTVPMIKVSDDQVKSVIGIRGKYACFNDFIDMSTGRYKLSSLIDQAYNKKPVERTSFDKDVIKVDERVNIVYMVYSGDFMRLFPIPGHPNDKWVTDDDVYDHFDSTDAGFVENILPLYYSGVNQGIQTGNWKTANEYLGYVKEFQRRYGEEIIPPVAKIKLEIAYNKFNVFKKLFPFYALTGFLLVILLFVNILNPKLGFKWPKRILVTLIALGFIAHTAGLAIRWYIGGHAPWSNGYETMIYIAWAIVLSGFLFSGKSLITLGATAILASLTLMVANLSWLDPEITNLVPVLRSYWLVIHVAVITASYSFLAIGALLGFLNLLLIIFQNKKNYANLNETIKELTNINEMNLIIGVFLITIGTFLGAVWANESWGRYWGWDPKETWALVTILVYSFVVHMRLIPGMGGIFAFNFAALISFSSVLMTYFGVNYYLSGMHSYASGDPVPIPSFVYYTIVVVFIVSILAYWKHVKMQKG